MLRYHAMYTYLGHHVTQAGQGKYSHVSLSLTVSLTNVTNVNDPLSMSDFDFHPAANFVPSEFKTETETAKF
jgi:hypothetical protein